MLKYSCSIKRKFCDTFLIIIPCTCAVISKCTSKNPCSQNTCSELLKQATGCMIMRNSGLNKYLQCQSKTFWAAGSFKRFSGLLPNFVNESSVTVLYVTLHQR